MVWGEVLVKKRDFEEKTSPYVNRAKMGGFKERQ